MNNGYIELRSGIKIPKVTFGTWRMNDLTDRGLVPVKAALKFGIRAIDTAQEYLTEDIVGDAINNSGIPRNEIILSTKLRPEAYLGEVYKEVSDEASAKDSIDLSLRMLNVDYIDIMYIHAEGRWTDGMFKNPTMHDNVGIAKALNDAIREGKIRSYGVSNFSVGELQKIKDAGLMLPEVIQMPYSIGYRDEALINFCRSNNIRMLAYSPLSSGNALKDPVVSEIAKKYDKTPAEVCLSYILQTIDGFVFSSGNAKHIKTNMNIKPFLEDNDIQRLKNINNDYLMWRYDKEPTNWIRYNSSMSHDDLVHAMDNYNPKDNSNSSDEIKDSAALENLFPFIDDLNSVHDAVSDVTDDSSIIKDNSKFELKNLDCYRRIKSIRLRNLEEIKKEIRLMKDGLDLEYQRADYLTMDRRMKETKRRHMMSIRNIIINQANEFYNLNDMEECYCYYAMLKEVPAPSDFIEYEQSLYDEFLEFSHPVRTMIKTYENSISKDNNIVKHI